MAKRIETVLIDDLDGSTADETLVFGLDGVNYEIDLSAANAASFRELLAPYIKVAQRVSGRRTRGTSGGRQASKGSDMRAWALAKGYEISERGRVPANVREAYEQAHS